MSAFVMSAKFFEALAENFAIAAESGNNICNLDYYISAAIRRYLGFHGTPYGRPRDAWDVAISRCRALYTANVDAVCQRYADDSPDDYATSSMIGTARSTVHKTWSAVQLVKHLQCLRYQMSEGTVPDEPLYKELNSLITELCESIVNSSTEYDAAAWGE